MLKIGHRGAKGHVKENTLLSFQKAIELGVDMIELDVHLSNDGIPMVIHDTTVDKTTNATGLVSEFSALDLLQLGIPTLENTLKFIENRCEINIEIKVFEATQPVLNLMEKYPFYKENILISSFDWNVLQEIKYYDDSIRIGVLTESDLDLAFAYAKTINAFSVHPYYHLLSKKFVKTIQKEKFKIYTWTVNEPEDIIFVQSLKVDGIITDFPERL